MHSPAMIIITNHLLELRAEADANRLAKKAQGARGESRGRIAAAFSSLRSLLLSPAERPIGLPKLTDYPYRS
jgi:hypothetical protein